MTQKNHKKYHTEIHTEKLDSSVTPILSVILWVNSLSWLKLLLLSGVPSLIKRKTYFSGSFLLVLSVRFLKQTERAVVSDTTELCSFSKVELKVRVAELSRLYGGVPIIR